MKTIQFAFESKNVQKTAEYLATLDVAPFLDQSVESIKTAIRAKVFKQFDRMYAGKLLENGAQIDSAFLHPAVVWRGIHCTFHSSSAYSGQTYAYQADIDSNSCITCVEVALHVTLGDPRIAVKKAPKQIDKFEFSSLVDKVNRATSNHEKGVSLEELMAYVFDRVDGFILSGQNVNTITEEIDLTLDNCDPTSKFHKEQAIVLVECKNWSKNCGKNEYVQFKEKIVNRRGKCSLGFFVAWGGFATTFKEEILRTSRENFVCVLLDRNDVMKMADTDPVTYLYDKWREATLT